MISKGSGNVVAIASVLAEYGIDHDIPYCASKAALRSLIESAREFCDSKGENLVKFSTIFPPKIQTPLFNHVDFT